MSVENLELIYAINDKGYIYIKFISLCYAHYWRYLFCVYSLSIPSTPPVASCKWDMLPLFRSQSFDHTVFFFFFFFFFFMSVAATAAAESNCNYIRPLQVSTPYLHCVSARPRSHDSGGLQATSAQTAWRPPERVGGPLDLINF